MVGSDEAGRSGMTEPALPPRVEDEAERGRFEVRGSGLAAGVRRLPCGGGLIAFIHAEIDERFEGTGLDGQLIASAFDGPRQNALAVLPFCPFVRADVARHPTATVLALWRDIMHNICYANCPH